MEYRFFPISGTVFEQGSVEESFLFEGLCLNENEIEMKFHFISFQRNHFGTFSKSEKLISAI